MDLIKKNWGLLLVAVLSLLGTLGLAWFLFGAMGQAKEAKAKLDKELEFFKGVQQDDVKLTDQNKATALQNADWAKDRFAKLRRQLHDKFRIEVKYDADPYRAVQELRTKIDKLRTRLIEEGIALSAQHQFLSFEEFAQSGVPPKKADMPELFRQYQVVEEIVAQLVQSKVAMINRIERPMSLEKRQEDLYTSIPIDLSVTGTGKSLNDLLNNFHTTAKYLFFVRKVELSSQDQAPGGVLGGTGTTGGGMGGMGGMGAMGAEMGGMGGMGGMGAMGAMGAEMGGGMGGMGMGGPGGMGMDQGGMAPGMEGGMGGVGTVAMPVLLTREQLRAFQDRFITAEIRLDLVEFTTPEEQQGE